MPNPDHPETLLHYRLGDKLGEGGMGVVYQATDTTLDRQVAIKILPAHFNDDRERLARFEREAKLLASLNHPNIAAIHSFHHAGDLHFLAMELVPGEDLAQRIARGSIPVGETVEIAGQIAVALETAHQNGVIHRDLKPANVKLTPDGVVKVLDFGLAKAAAPDASMSGGSPTDPSFSPTVTSLGTAAHVILGTAAYMSPEQARGRPVDRRTDVWALGVVVFEMLTGRLLFHGETISDTLASVLKIEPDWGQLPATTPPALRRLLRRCLVKNPKERLHDAADARIELAHIFDEPGGDASTGDALSGTAPRPRAGLLAGVAALGLAVGAALGFVLMKSIGEDAPTAPAEKVVSELVAPPGTTISVRRMSISLAPDGRRLAFLGVDATGLSYLWVRDLTSGETVRLEGTEGAESPFWSPDGREIGFHADSRLLRIDAGGGEPRLIAEVFGIGGSWSPDGKILFSPSNVGWLLQVDADGGEPESVLMTNLSERLEPSAPQFLPDGRHFLFKIEDLEGGASGIYTGELGSGEAELLLAGLTNAVYAEGWLFYLKDDSLMARRFDTDTLELTGEPRRIAGPVLRFNYPFHGFFTVAARGGRLAYLSSADTIGNAEMVWVDRTGRELERTGIEGDLYNPRLSHDGRLLGLDVSTPETHGDIWVFDLVRRSSRRLTRDPIDESRPTWFPDDATIAFFRKPDLYVIDAAGGSEARQIYTNEHDKYVHDASPDGRSVIFGETVDGQSDLRWLDLDSGEASDWLAGEFNERGARFSPDGNWIAYESDEPGRTEVYVDRFPARGERFRVSTDGGTHSAWRADGRELYYVSRSNDLMAVPVEMDSERNPIGRPVKLFSPRLRRDHFEPAPDGQRFLISELKAVEMTSVTLVQSWPADLD